MRVSSARNAVLVSHQDVATGQIIDPSWGPPRCEDDGVAHLQRLIARSPETTQWQPIMDNVDIHRSEALVRWIADLEGTEQEPVGGKGTRGMVPSMKSRAAFVHDPTHSVGCSSTPHMLPDEPCGQLAASSGAHATHTAPPSGAARTPVCITAGLSEAIPKWDFAQRTIACSRFGRVPASFSREMSTLSSLRGASASKSVSAFPIRRTCRDS
jgi:hypothetical protein